MGTTTQELSDWNNALDSKRPLQFNPVGRWYGGTVTPPNFGGTDVAGIALSTIYYSKPWPNINLVERFGFLGKCAYAGMALNLLVLP
jgi:hypothetical protein